MKRSISNKKIIAYITGIILLIVLWQIFSLLIGQRVMVLPGPRETFEYALYLLGKSYTYKCIASTMGKMLSGFAISFVLALVLGMIAANSEFLEEMFKPFLITLRAIPTASLIYLFIILSGYKNAPMLLVIMICFPIIYEGVKDGIKNIPEGISNATKVDGASLLEENIRVRLPLSFPYLIVALATSFSLSFKIEIMAEVITGSTNAGLGSAIAGARASDPTNMVPIFGYSLIAVAMMLIIDLIDGLLINRFQKYNVLKDE
ncbi:MAG: ABC transporter permease subunit [Erysipelotrichaceae bacterium]|nr:ABC transporter permease subunit [Erysipelotrichaceae bacterium]